MSYSMEISLLVFMTSMEFGYFLAVTNLCQITLAKRGRLFKLANFLIFLVYLFPMIAPFANWKLRPFNDGFGLFVMPTVAILHFLYLLFACRRLRINQAWKIAKFTTALLAMSIICTIVWQEVVTEYLYDCTDDNNAGFLTPGNWVHSWGGHPIVVVDRVIHERSRDEPDTIKRGWNIAGLWWLWISFVVTSLIISFAATLLPWIPGRKAAASFGLAPGTAPPAVASIAENIN